MKRVQLKISWVELLGAKQADMPDDVRRDRWNRWLELAAIEDPGLADFWQDASGCEDCIHRDGNWCKLQRLPVTVNPFLTMKHSMIGMACMGAGYEVREPKLFDEAENGIPF